MREKQIKTTIYYTPTRMAKIVKLKLVNIDKGTDLNSSWLLMLPRWLSGKESTCQCRRCRRCGSDPWVGKIPWRRKWQPTPVFSSGKSHGQRAAVHGVASVGYDLVTKQQQDTHKFTSLPVFDVQFSGITYIQSLVQTSLLIYHPKRKLCPH